MVVFIIDLQNTVFGGTLNVEQRSTLRSYRKQLRRICGVDSCRYCWKLTFGCLPCITLNPLVPRRNLIFVQVTNMEMVLYPYTRSPKLFSWHARGKRCRCNLIGLTYKFLFPGLKIIGVPWCGYELFGLSYHKPYPYSNQTFWFSLFIAVMPIPHLSILNKFYGNIA